MEKFNQEQLMLYVYEEASPILKLAIANAIKDDPALRKEVRTMQRTRKQLDELKKKNYVPDPTSIEAILNYAGRKKQ